MRPALALPVVLGLLCGCGGGMTVTARVREPAVLPLRSFPRIWIATGHEPREARLSRALARHLEAGAVAQVRRVAVDELEPLRLEGRIPVATVVVLLVLGLEERTRTEWGTRPETVCGPAGCYTSQRSYVVDVPVVEGDLAVTVYDGPTARVLQQVRLRASREGSRPEVLEARVLAGLDARLRRMVDQRAVAVAVELLPVALPEVEAALSEIERGRWGEGRALLERAVRSAAFRRLEAVERAEVLYDLGVARRFDPATADQPASHFAAAARALEAAVRLDPRPFYREAIGALERHRAQREVLDQQRAAAAHNYRIGAQPEGVPDPPASYGPQAQPEPEPGPAPRVPPPDSPDVGSGSPPAVVPTQGTPEAG